MADKQFDNNYDYQDSITKQILDGTISKREKPVVHYKSLGHKIIKGQRATIKTIDHVDDSLNYAPWVHTSKVVAVESNGDFESTYTKYVLVK